MGFGVEDFGTPGAVETKFSLRLIYTQYIPKLIYLLTYSMVAALPLPFEEWQGWGRNGDGGGYVEKKSFLSELYIPYTSITRVYTLSKLLTDLTKWVLVFPIQGGDPPTPPQPQPPPLQIYTWETYYNFMVLAVYECVSGIFMHWQNTDQIAVYQWKKKIMQVPTDHLEKPDFWPFNSLQTLVKCIEGHAMLYPAVHNDYIYISARLQ